MFSYKMEITVTPLKIGEFMDFCHSIANELRHEKGYRTLHLYQNTDDTQNYVLFSEWESKQSMENHLRGDRFSLLKGAAIVLGKSFKLKIGEALIADYSNWTKLDLAWKPEQEI